MSAVRLHDGPRSDRMAEMDMERLLSLLREIAEMPLEEATADEALMAASNTISDIGNRVDGVLAAAGMYWAAS